MSKKVIFVKQTLVTPESGIRVPVVGDCGLVLDDFYYENLDMIPEFEYKKLFSYKGNEEFVEKGRFHTEDGSTPKYFIYVGDFMPKNPAYTFSHIYHFVYNEEEDKYVLVRGITFDNGKFPRLW